MKGFIIKISDFLYECFKIFDILLLGILAILTFLGVVARYIFNNPIVWNYEITLILFSWLIFSGVSVAFKTGENIRIDLFNQKSKKIKKSCAIIGNIATILFLLFTIKEGINIVKNTWHQQYNTIVLSTAWFYLPLPLCGSVSLIHFIASYAKGKNPLITKIITNKEEA